MKRNKASDFSIEELFDRITMYRSAAEIEKNRVIELLKENAELKQKLDNMPKFICGFGFDHERSLEYKITENGTVIYDQEKLLKELGKLKSENKHFRETSNLYADIGKKQAEIYNELMQVFARFTEEVAEINKTKVHAVIEKLETEKKKTAKEIEELELEKDEIDGIEKILSEIEKDFSLPFIKKMKILFYGENESIGPIIETVFEKKGTENENVKKRA